jgi:hypothetical protein
MISLNFTVKVHDHAFEEIQHSPKGVFGRTNSCFGVLSSCFPIGWCASQHARVGQHLSFPSLPGLCIAPPGVMLHHAACLQL